MGGEKGRLIRFLKCLSSCKLMRMNRGWLYKTTNPRAKGHLTTPKGRRKLGGYGGGTNNKGCIKMVNNGSQSLSPELKWSMRFSLSSHLKPCVLLMWFIKRLSQAPDADALNRVWRRNPSSGRYSNWLHHRLPNCKSLPILAPHNLAKRTQKKERKRNEQSNRKMSKRAGGVNKGGRVFSQETLALFSPQLVKMYLVSQVSYILWGSQR